MPNITHTLTSMVTLYTKKEVLLRTLHVCRPTLRSSDVFFLNANAEMAESLLLVQSMM